MSAVVSERARSGIEYFMAEAAKSSFVRGDQFAGLTTEQDVGTESQVVMLTVSSYTFRLLMFIHFNDDASTRAYLASLVSKSADQLVGEGFSDAIMERGNLFCGALNRDLATYFPHIGMSTPCVLSRIALDHVDTIQPTLVRRYRAQISDSFGLRLTLVLCSDGDLDFGNVLMFKVRRLWRKY
jgi:hypothetical protein